MTVPPRTGAGAAVLSVRPSGPLGGAFTPPGDKSITHRAYLLALVAEGETRVEAANPGADCSATLDAAVALGAAVRRSDGTVHVTGTAGELQEPDGIVDCGNSGTTLRLLAGVLAARPMLTVLTGDDSLRRRPVARIVEPLRRMGAELWARAGDRLPPLAVRGAHLRGISLDLHVASAQVASCVLLAGLAADGTTRVRIPGPARDHTERMLPAFGVEVMRESHAAGATRVGVRGGQLPRGTTVRVPGDVSAAAFFLAAAAATPGARVTAHGVGLNPTRLGLFDALRDMGAGVTITEGPEAAGEPTGDVTVTGPERLRAIALPPEWLPRMIDEVPAWCVAAAAAEGTSTLSGAAELRLKESDRIATLAAGLSALGITAEERPDGLAITGGPAAGGVVDAAGDHRIAMAFAVLGARARGPVRIDAAQGIATSYPSFTATFRALGGVAEEGTGKDDA